MLGVSREEITGGSLPRVLAILTVPLLAQNLALVAQQVVDLFWVGRLGGDAVAAVGLSTVVVGVVTVPVLGITIGSQVVTAQRVGADEIRAARRVPFNAAWAGLAISVVLGAALVLFAPTIVGLFGTGQSISEMAVAYLTAYALALVATAVSDGLESGFTGWGDTRAAFLVNVTAIVVNLIADPLLILGVGPFPRLEVFGAALATAIGYAVGAAFALALLLRGRGDFRLTRRAVVPDLGTVRAIADVGWPIAGQNAGRQGARLVMVGIVAAVGGGPGLTAYHIGSQVATVAFVPAQGLGQAATSVVGQNLGAGRPDRAARATLLSVGAAVLGLGVLGILQWAIPAELARLFVPGLAGQALTFSVAYLQILAVGYWALGAIYTVEAGFNGADRTTVSMVSTLCQYWAVRVPFAVAGGLVLGLGVEAVFWAVTLSNVAAALWLVAYFRYSNRQRMLHRAAADAGAAGGDA